MPIKKYLDRIIYIDSLIRRKATGSTKQLALKLNLSERRTLEYIKSLKEMGCPIKYCRKRNSYFYNGDGNISISFFSKNIEEQNTSVG